ncbi:MAG: hypothetical protein JXR35_00800 [Rhodobacteraceae bacterium]|nr:hypothetical protein [Paracoccaceae bacterium]
MSNFYATSVALAGHNRGSLHLPAPSRANRSIASRSKGHCVVNAVLGRDHGQVVEGESYTEYKNLLILNADPAVADFRVQAEFFYGPKRKQRHYFDVLKTMVDGRVIAETVKPTAKLRSGVFLREMAEVAWWVREFSFADEVRLITEADIDPIDLHNGRVFAGVRLVDAAALAQARLVVSQLTGSVGLRDLVNEIALGAPGYRALLHLLAQNELQLTRRERITPQSNVRRKEQGK